MIERYLLAVPFIHASLSLSLNIDREYLFLLVFRSQYFARSEEIELEEMGDYPRDARIKLSIGTKQEGDAECALTFLRGLAFDHHRGLLLVVDTNNYRVQVFSCDDGGSFVSKFGEQATNQASSCILRVLRSITIMIASSSLIAPTIEYNHGH